MSKIKVIIPAYNEEKKAINEILKIVNEVIVISNNQRTIQ
jgi:glycosyltransferase involved in cell wall biosynthesis